jgi:hypothetical protein
MSIFFEMVKGFFFFLSVAVGVLFLRGALLLDEATYLTVKAYLMPGYLIFCGLMVGYLVSHIWLSSYDAPGPDLINSIYVKSFLVGIVIGVVLALSYMFI